MSINNARSIESKNTFIVRCPIVNSNRNIAGNELYAFSKVSTQDKDARDIALFVNAVANRDAPFSTYDFDLFVHASSDSLADLDWNFLNPRNVVALVPPIEDDDADHIERAAVTLKNYRSLGFRLAFHHGVVSPNYLTWQPLADFVMLDLASVQYEDVRPLVKTIGSRTTANTIATNVWSDTQFGNLKSMGIQLFQGSLFASPEVSSPRISVHAEASAVKLLELLISSAPVEAVENVFRKNPVLVVNLLLIIKSAGQGLGCKITSLREAIMSIGYAKLAKWSVTVLAMFPFNPNSNLAHFDAMVRARMMELLAGQSIEPLNAGSAFLIGLLSKIDTIFGSSLQIALEKLSISAEIADLILRRKGVYGDMLLLAQACETELELDFSYAFSKLNFSLRQIHRAHTDALAWAEDNFYCST